MSPKEKPIDTIEGEMGRWLGTRYVATVDSLILKKLRSTSDILVFEFGEMKNLLASTEGLEELLEESDRQDEARKHQSSRE